MDVNGTPDATDTSGINWNEIGNRFQSALTNPLITGLMGMTQGFAQAAMPTRMPTPWGAVLGAGSGGMLQGLQTGQALTKGGIENQRAKMLMDFYRNTYPGGGSGSSDASSSGGTAAGIPASPYLVPPQQLKMLGDLAMATGQDRSAAALYTLPNTMAGGAGYAMGPGGGAFAVPGGAADPRTILAKSGAEAWGKVAPAVATTGGNKAAEAPYMPPVTVQQPILDANGHVVGTQDVQVPVPQWAGQNGGRGAPTSAFPANGARPTTPQGASVAGLSSLPNDSTRSVAINAALKAGLPVEAWAPWISSVHTESKWNLNSPDGAAGEIGPGQVKPSTGAMYGFTPEQLRDPATNLVASAKYFGDQWKQSGGNPAVAMTGYNAGDVNARQGDYAKAGMGRLAQWGYPGTAPSIATSPIGPVPAVAPSPTGMGGQVTLTPAAKANLDIRTAWQKPESLRAGGSLPVPPGVNPAMPAGGVLQAPHTEELVNPGGVAGPAHIILPNPYGDPNAPATAVPVQMAPGPGAGASPPVGSGAAQPALPQPANAVSKLPPDVTQGREELVKGLFGKDTDSYVAANNTQGWLNQINHAAEVMGKAGTFYATGEFAPQRLALIQGINDVGRSLNLGTPFDEKAGASAEEMRKATTTAGFELSSHYEGHARQAAATIMNATSAVPGISNSPKGLVLVSNGINEGAQSAIDMHNYKIARYAGQDPLGIAPETVGNRGGSGLESAEADYVKAFPARMYSDRAISTVTPFKINSTDQTKAMAEMAKYLPGTVVVLPNGKQTMVPPRPNAPPVPNYMRGYVQGGSNAP